MNDKSITENIALTILFAIFVLFANLLSLPLATEYNLPIPLNKQTFVLHMVTPYMVIGLIVGILLGVPFGFIIHRRVILYSILVILPTLVIFGLFSAWPANYWINIFGYLFMIVAFVDFAYIGNWLRHKRQDELSEINRSVKKQIKILNSVFIALAVFAIGVYLMQPLISTKYTKKEYSYDVLPLPQDSLFKRFMFPLQVNAFTSKYSKPSDTYVDESDCPFGQLHRWRLSDENIELLVLGDDYNSQANYDANCRLYAIQKIMGKKPTKFAEIWGINLGDSEVTVKKKLQMLTNNDSSLILTQDTGESILYKHLMQSSMKHQYILNKGDVYLFFMIGKNGTLETIMFTTFDVRFAC